MLGLTRENLTGVRVVRAFDKEQSEIDRFESANDLLTRMQLHVGHISSLMSPLTYVIINLAIVALLYVGSIEINVGGMASGDVIPAWSSPRPSRARHLQTRPGTLCGSTMSA